MFIRQPSVQASTTIEESAGNFQTLIATIVETTIAIKEKSKLTQTRFCKQFYADIFSGDYLWERLYQH